MSVHHIGNKVSKNNSNPIRPTAILPFSDKSRPCRRISRHRRSHIVVRRATSGVLTCRHVFARLLTNSLSSRHSGRIKRREPCGNPGNKTGWKDELRFLKRSIHSWMTTTFICHNDRYAGKYLSFYTIIIYMGGTDLRESPSLASASLPPTGHLPDKKSFMSFTNLPDLILSVWRPADKRGTSDWQNLPFYLPKGGLPVCKTATFTHHFMTSLKSFANLLTYINLQSARKNRPKASLWNVGTPKKSRCLTDK